MKTRRLKIADVLLGGVLLLAGTPIHADDARPPGQGAVGPQYSTTHVYVPEDRLDDFVTSFVGTFGGTASPPNVAQITPTPSSTAFRAIRTPIGVVSAFGFKTPVPYPFGFERTGYLVADMDNAIATAKQFGAAVLVTPFPDAIGRDAIIQWPGGVNMQLYWHSHFTASPPLQRTLKTASICRRKMPTHSSAIFSLSSQGTVTSDQPVAPGIEIGRPGESYRRVRIASPFGNLTLLITDGHLPFPYGHEMTGYEVSDLTATLDKAKASGAKILVAPYTADQRSAAMVGFPGGYIAEIHAPANP